MPETYVGPIRRWRVKYEVRASGSLGIGDVRTFTVLASDEAGAFDEVRALIRKEGLEPFIPTEIKDLGEVR